MRESEAKADPQANLAASQTLLVSERVCKSLGHPAPSFSFLSSSANTQPVPFHAIVP